MLPIKYDTFTLSEVKPSIFFMDFKDNYEMSMTFLRYQEFYESPNAKFRGKSFKILDFMKWYSKKYGKGAFTYPKDWGGFNLPGNTIRQVRDLSIPDYNEYDAIMKEVHNECVEKAKVNKFYLIGAIGKNKALKHEIAHGLFYTNQDYKKQMTKLVKQLPKAFRDSMSKTLKEMGYANKVFIDEIQAYLSTGLAQTFKVQLNGEDKPFIKIYKEFYKKV